MGKGLEGIAQPPLARLGDHHAVEAAVLERPKQLARQRARVVRILVADVAHR
jgi:hypothetical protein